MRRTIRTILLLSAATSLAASTMPFLPVLRFRELQGNHTIRKPDSTAFEAIDPRRVYPYGSMIQTGESGWLLLEFSKKNECKFGPGCLATFWQSESHPWKDKKIELDRGEVEVRVEDEFRKTNSLSVVSAPVTCDALRGKFVVEVAPAAERRTVELRCIDGNVRVEVPGMLIDALEPAREISISGTPDGRFVSIRNRQGQCTVDIHQDGNTLTNVPLRVDAMIKRWSQPVPSSKKHAVTVAIFSSEGKIDARLNYLAEKTTKE